MFCKRIFLKACITLAVFSECLDAQIPQSQVEIPSSRAPTEQGLRRQQEQKVQSDEILIPALKGLSISASAPEALASQAEGKEGVHADTFSEPQSEKLKETLRPWLGKPVTLETLEDIARDAERAISLQPGSLITASFPPQEITSGHIAMVVATPLLRSVSFTGTPKFGAEFLRRAVLTRPGMIASAETIRKDIEFLNRNPFRETRALWSPASGDVPSANLIIQLKEKRPWSIYAGVDNFASEDLGDERLYLGGKLGNAFGLDHRFGWILLNSANGNSLHAASFTYEIPLPDHRLLNLSTGMSESESSGSALVDNNGRFFHMRALLETPLPDWKNLRHRWRSGFSLRENSYQQSTGETDIRIFQFENFWEGELFDPYGSTTFTGGLIWNPGDVLISSRDATYEALGANDSDSLVATFKAERAIPWKKYGTWKLSVEGQWAAENLLATNQFSAAGPQRVRGYDEGSQFYDKALFASTEWQFRRVPLPAEMSLRPHIFFDTAWLADHDGQCESISSIGAGCLWAMQPNYAARIELALPLNDPDNEGRDPQVIFSLNTYW